MFGAVMCAAVMFAATTSRAEEQVILDYQDPQFRMAMPGSNAAERRHIAMALRSVATEEIKALGNDFVILGGAEGKLFGAGEVDFHLISSEEPVAIEPFVDRPAQVILALKNDQAAGSFHLPEELQFTRVVGAVDIDGDGASEVLLEANTMNMGELHTAVYAIRLEGEMKASVAQMLSGAFVDTCDTPHGERSRIAMSISLEGGELKGTPHKESCG